ncbi:MAG: hypothetical protein ACK5PQ_05025 [Alphaproteobacteria bacterium]
MRYTFLFCTFLATMQAQAFYLPFRPIEQIKYRSGACGDDLQRLTYALLKERTYTGCLTAGLEALQQKGSALWNQFNRDRDNKKSRYRTPYDPQLKMLLMTEIHKRLDPQYGAQLPMDLPPSEESRAQFRDHLRQFCHHHPVFGTPAVATPMMRIEHHLGSLNLSQFFSSFRTLLKMAETLESGHPQVMKGMKKLRQRLLVVLNDVILLKKVLTGQSLPEGTDSVSLIMERLVKRTEWVVAYHELKIVMQLSDACQTKPSMCKKIFVPMDDLAGLVQSFDDLKGLCRASSNRVDFKSRTHDEEDPVAATMRRAL